MTHTTTDAAEARALTIARDMREAFDKLAVSTRYDATDRERWAAARTDTDEIIRLLATAEAESGAGEREAIRRAYIAGCEQGWELPRDEGPTDAAERYAAGYAASLPPATDPAMVADAADWMEEARKAAAATRPRSPWAKAVMRGDRDDSDEVRAAMFAIDATRAALAAAPTIPATGEAIRAVTAEMRRFMPTACGDWADKIDDALAEEKGRKVAFYDEGGIDIRPGESLADRDRRIYQQGRHDALNDEPEAFI